MPGTVLPLVGTAVGAIVGTSTVTTYVESASGVAEARYRQEHRVLSRQVYPVHYQPVAAHYPIP